MKYLTKNWSNKYNQVKLIYRLKETENFSRESYEKIRKKAKMNFIDRVKSDPVYENVPFDRKNGEKMFEAYINNRKNALLTLPKEIIGGLKHKNFILYGYCSKQDKEILSQYAENTLKAIEATVKKANRQTEIAQDYLPEEIELNNYCENIVYGIETTDKNYYIDFGNSGICVENYKVLQDDGTEIHKWDENDPISPWTILHAVELHYISENRYELHLMFTHADEYENLTNRYLTLQGTNVKAYRKTL